MGNILTTPSSEAPALACDSATLDLAHFRARISDLRAQTVHTGRLPVSELIPLMPRALVHYAGAAHRDRVAWYMCLAYLEDRATGRESDEAELKSRALRAAHGWSVSPDQLRAAV